MFESLGFEIYTAPQVAVFFALAEDYFQVLSVAVAQQLQLASGGENVAQLAEGERPERADDVARAQARDVGARDQDDQQEEEAQDEDHATHGDPLLSRPGQRTERARLRDGTKIVRNVNRPSAIVPF